jgi:hypothetical protein
MIRRRLRIAVVAVSAILALGLTSAAALGSSYPATASYTAHAHAGTTDTAATFSYQDESGMSGGMYVECFRSTASGLLEWANVGSGCRNRDVAFFSDWPGPIRLYYSPDRGGAWVCVPPGWGGSLAGYTFNNGSGDAGYGDPVKNDVASSYANDSGSCSNPDSP